MFNRRHLLPAITTAACLLVAPGAPFALIGPQPAAELEEKAPQVTITAAPSNPSNDDSPSFSFVADKEVTFRCKLDEGAFASCNSPKGYANVAQGPHTFTVRATDEDDNTGQANHSWTIDTTAPTVTITEKPSNPSNTGSPAFAFTSNESVGGFACRLEQGGFQPCSPPKSYAGLIDGQHAFAVRATDAAGNTGVAATYTWTIDTVAPTTAITGKPGDPSNNSSPGFSFTASEQGSAFVCRLDNGSMAACTSPAGYTNIADGPHSFAVKATDPAGNTGPDTSYSWTIETRAPTAAVTSAPSGLDNSSSATFAFSADEPATFDCNVDGRGYGACNSPASYHGLGDGAHAFTVRARDAVGNLSAPVAHVWTIDTTSPETTLASAPKSATTATSATFRFSANENGTFECRLDGRPFTLCASPKSYGGLTKATHQFEVRAVDSAGNADATPSLHRWKIEAAATRTASSALLSPRAGARVTRPPVLVWRRVGRARYYNVQVFRGSRKVFTGWPTRTRLQLRVRWRYRGRQERLVPGSYRWYVWPGYGPPSARRYGPLLGQSTFVVARPSARTGT